MEIDEAQAMVALLEAGWGPLPESMAALYQEEFRGVECAQCLCSGIRNLVREMHFCPRIADVLDEYVAEHREAHRGERPELVAEASWTDEDERESAKARAEAFAQWHEKKRVIEDVKGTGL